MCITTTSKLDDIAITDEERDKAEKKLSGNYDEEDDEPENDNNQKMQQMNQAHQQEEEERYSPKKEKYSKCK